MKKPKTGDLKHDVTETRRIRSAMLKPQNVKIVINIESETLVQLRELAAQSGIPYQSILNRFVKTGLVKSNSTESRLEKLEKELDRLKKKLVA
ncbi:MAG: hypothetical protein HW386_532 [Gammaproteobacteria bacterium]|nr:hypothetical protein [Gammaproteobacteria bacterium]